MKVAELAEKGYAPKQAAKPSPLRAKPCNCGGSCSECQSQEHALSREASRAVRPAEAPPPVQQTLNSPGQSLDTDTRGYFEGRFGRDFSHIRIHSDAHAAQSAKAVNAAAYTVGRHIVFDEGHYHPESHSGRELMAHELTHTVQQDQAGNSAGLITMAELDHKSEKEAASNAAAISSQKSLPVKEQARGIQRQPNPSIPPSGLDLRTGLAESASPFLASAIGSVTIDGFETGKSSISSTNQTKLAGAASTIQILLNKYPGSTVRVTGHTDAMGKEANNETLGQSRADSVRAALHDLGIPAETLQTQSMGETQLLVKTQKPEPRNRRVEVHFEPLSQRFAKILPESSLTPPEQPKDTPKPPIPDISPWKYKPKQEDAPPSLPPSMWKDIPPLRKSPGSSIDDKLNDLAGKITSFLPKSIREKARELVKDAIEKGIGSGLDSALQSAGVNSTDRGAIEKAVDAALKQKIGGTP